MENIRQLIQPVTDIALRAGQEIMEVYNAGDIELEHKQDASPLTLADRRANDLIVKRLNALGTNWPIISEESKQIPYADRADAELLWMVDPLDGTKEFVKRNGEFTVNIALIHQGDPILGVVYAPAKEELFWAAQGAGAYSRISGTSDRLNCTTFSMDQSGLRIVCSRSHLNEATQSYIADLDAPELVRTGSSLKFTIIARGLADIYPRLGPTMEWDTAAAHCILKEAGGILFRSDNGEPLRYNKQDLLNPHFIAMGDRLQNV